MPKGLDSLYGLIGEAVWNKLSQGRQETSSLNKMSGTGPSMPNRGPMPDWKGQNDRWQASFDSIQSVNPAPPDRPGGNPDREAWFKNMYESIGQKPYPYGPPVPNTRGDWVERLDIPYSELQRLNEMNRMNELMLRDYGQPPLTGATGQAQVPDYVKASMYGNAYKGY